MFENDLFPGKPKILFIGNPTSSHVQGWINLLDNAEFNIRLFSSADGYPPNDWPVKVYLTTHYPPEALNPEFRISWWPLPEEWFIYENDLKNHQESKIKASVEEVKKIEELRNLLQSKVLDFVLFFDDIGQYIKTINSELIKQKKIQNQGKFGKISYWYYRIKNESNLHEQIHTELGKISSQFQRLDLPRFTSELKGLSRRENHIQTPQSKSDSPESWLAEVIKEWKPDIIHTFGLDAGSKFYFDARKKYQLENYGKWIIKVFGGSDLAFNLFDPDTHQRIGQMFSESSQVIFDNTHYIKMLVEMGLLPTDKVSPLSPIPGSGGVDVDGLTQKWQGKTSSRRIIIWPKSYETIWSKSVPVLMALKNVWDEIQPCEVYLLTATGEIQAWISTLPDKIKAKFRLFEGVPREEVFDIMLSSRLVLALSLIDGFPNTVYEAMACGAIPIVSPLETIRDIVDDNNVLFANNLDQPAIEQAIVRVMNDDVLVDEMSRKNIDLVKKLADIEWIKPKVNKFYEEFSR